VTLPVQRRACVVLALVAAFVNLPALVPGFILDDHAIVERNPLVRDLASVPRIFVSGYWSVGGAPTQNLYRPLTILSFALSHLAGGDHPLGDRLINLLLHVLVTLLVYALARRAALGGPASAAAGARTILDPPLLAALLFAVHPVHTEVLGMVVGRADLLASAATLGCILSFLRAREREADAESRAAEAKVAPRSAGGWYALSLACLAAGVLSKESAMIAPLLVLLADRLLARSRGAWRFHAASAATLGLCLALRVAVLGGLNPAGPIQDVDNPIVGTTPLLGRLTALRVIERYALLLVAPLRLSVDYSYDAVPVARGLLEPQVLAGGLIVVACVAGAALAWRRDPGLAFSLGWIVLAFAPVSNLLVPIGTIMAERLLYLPSVGFCLLAARGLGRLEARLLSMPGSRWRRAPAQIAGPVLLLALGLRSEARFRDWQDDFTLFKSALEVAPRSVKVQFNYGAACEGRGDDEAAAAAYLAALRIWPGFAEAHYNLAGVRARQKDWADAVAHSREALRLRPGEVTYLVNLAHALLGQGRPAEARDLLNGALAIDRGSREALTNLGAAELALGDAGAAVRAYAEAVGREPRNADLLRDLGLARERAGDDAGAEAALQEAVRIRPDDPILRYDLGRALERRGRLVEAEAGYRRSIDLAPEAAPPRRALGLLLYRAQDRAGARAELERAAALDVDGTVMDDAARRALADLRRPAP